MESKNFFKYFYIRLEQSEYKLTYINVNFIEWDNIYLLTSAWKSLETKGVRVLYILMKKLFQYFFAMRKI